MKKAILTLLPLCTLASGLEPPDTTFEQVAQGFELEWDGAEGVSYFVMGSADLHEWVFFDSIEQGVGHYQFGFIPNGEDKMFFRVVATDVPMDNPNTFDLDGDGIGNLAEINASSQTSPLKWDSDGDGLNDGWELLMNFDPTVAGTGVQDPTANNDGDSFTNLMESVIGLDPSVGVESASSSGAGLEIYIPN